MQDFAHLQSKHGSGREADTGPEAAAEQRSRANEVRYTVHRRLVSKRPQNILDCHPVQLTSCGSHLPMSSHTSATMI